MIIIYPICCQLTRMISPQKPYHSFKPECSLVFCKDAVEDQLPDISQHDASIRFGIKKIVRKIFVPFIFCVSAIASANAKTLITIRDTAANRQVYQNECRNTVSLSASI